MRARTLAGFLQLALASALCTCVDSAPLRPSSGDEATSGDEPADEEVSARPCARVRQATRTFVGLAEGMSLSDFESTAVAAERILDLLKRRLCRLAPALDPDGGMRAALLADGVRITSVEFTAADLSAARAQIERGMNEPPPATAGTAPDPERFVLQLRRHGDDWDVSSLAPVTDANAAQ